MAQRNRDYRGNNKGNGNRKPKSKPQRRTSSEVKEVEHDRMNAEGRDNNPNWYFTSKEMADQVSQLSFQQIAGLPLKLQNKSMVVSNYKGNYFNPSAGYSANGQLDRLSSINLAGFRTFTKMSAFTGRTTTSYAPQDISIMILALGELISQFEWIRRVFGVAFMSSERNRSIPIHILEKTMRVNATDFYSHYQEYRIQFNKLVTLANQIPIPKGIAYFDKCAAMYEKLYIDESSPMATIIVDSPATSWQLDETSYPGGSILKTISWCGNATNGTIRGVINLSYYLNDLANTLDALLNSSTLNIVYTDLINLASKMNIEFWKFDYLTEGYMVVPELNANHALQMHNATITGIPTRTTSYSAGGVLTPYNDVYPDPNNNMLQYRPGFSTHTSNNIEVPRLMDEVIIDVLDPNISVEDRVEMTRYISAFTGTIAQVDNDWVYYAVLPDHYMAFTAYFSVGDGTALTFDGTLLASYGYNGLAMFTQTRDCEIHYVSNPTSQNRFNIDGGIIGNLNFYTVVDYNYIERLHQFMGLALYDMR